MILKTTFKSHFRIKKTFSKNKNKSIFVKNIIVFFLFSKIFLKNCRISFFFKNFKKLQTNILKAPSRHKKFFHQVGFEVFFFKVFFFFNKYVNIPIQHSEIFFLKLNGVFIKFGTNTLTRVKFLTILNTGCKFLNFF